MFLCCGVCVYQAANGKKGMGGLKEVVVNQNAIHELKCSATSSGRNANQYDTHDGLISNFSLKTRVWNPPLVCYKCWLGLMNTLEETFL